MDEYACNLKEMPKRLYNECIDPSIHTISDFLSRYAIITQGTWNSSSTKGAVLFTTTLPKDLFNNVYNITQNLNKVDGFVGLKARVLLS